MIPAEVQQVLSFCASVDSWVRAADPDAAALMLAGWSDMLAGVPLPTAMAAARSHYAVPGQRSLTPGDVLAFHHEQRRSAAHEVSEAEARELAAGSEQPALRLGTTGANYLRALQSAILAGTAPPPMPADLPTITRAADVWERRCTYHELCACPHTDCRDGWSDAEGTVMNGLRKTYPAAQRCAHCKDALLMAEEQGIAKKPSRHAARR